VTLGETRDGEVRVLAGLNSGERVVVEGVERLTDGNRVTESRR
jgi:multidrug efflux pump subunit AcrA (membrane-fusion protein)